jgi:hypothetical protein
MAASGSRSIHFILETGMVVERLSSIVKGSSVGPGLGFASK